jgi:molecular chaperone GrpE
MKRKKHDDEHDGEIDEQDLLDGGAEDSMDAGEASDAVAAVAQKLADAEARIVELQDKFQRSLAEQENARKRHQREMSEYRVQAVGGLVKELLPVLDNLRRAIGNAPGGGRQDDPIVAGVKLVLDQFEHVLAAHGVSAIDAVGQAFDPNLHEAMGNDLRDDVAPGTVTEELVKGYRLGERLLRASVVRVAKAAGAAEDPRRDQPMHEWADEGED